MICFEVDMQKKRGLSKSALYSSAGGRVFLAIVILLLAFAVASSQFILGNESIVRKAIGLNGDVDLRTLSLIPVAIGVVVAVMALLILYRQSNTMVAMRKDERLVLDENDILHYGFHSSGDRGLFWQYYPAGRHEIEISLQEATDISFDSQKKIIRIEGPVTFRHYEDFQNEPEVFDEEESSLDYEIVDYFKPSLREKLEPYVK